VRRGFVIVVLALAIAGVACGDPSRYCEQNRMRVAYNETCEVSPSAIAIDGDLDDWQPLLTYPPDCTGCGSGEVSGMYVTTTTDDEIAIYAATVGAPLTDVAHSYYIELSPLAGPYYGFGFQVRPSNVEVMLRFVQVDGVAVRAAYGPTGVELAVPRTAVPFTVGANAFGELDAREFGSWVAAQDFFPYLATACWDASSPLCQPL
jgi:hypothetical protein